MGNVLLAWRGTVVQLGTIFALVYVMTHHVDADLSKTGLGGIIAIAILATTRAKNEALAQSVISAVTGVPIPNGGTGSSLYPAGMPRNFTPSAGMPVVKDPGRLEKYVEPAIKVMALLAIGWGMSACTPSCAAEAIPKDICIEWAESRIYDAGIRDGSPQDAGKDVERSGTAVKTKYNFALVDLTTDTTPDNLRPALNFDAFISAWVEQVTGPYADAWGDQWVSFRIASCPSDRSTDEIGINFRDSLDVDGALAYHSVLNGVPDIEIGCDLFSNLDSGFDSVVGGGAHELLETLMDPGANQWADCGNGVMRAKEAVDTVQNVGYNANNGLWVPNFLLPAAFIPGSVGPWDYLGLMKSQDDYSNGYEIQTASPNDIQQVSGVHGARTYGHKLVYCRIGKMSELQKKRKLLENSRTHRRGVRLR